MPGKFNLGNKERKNKKLILDERMGNQSFFVSFLAFSSECHKSPRKVVVPHFTPLMQLPWEHPSCCRVSRAELAASERLLLWLCIWVTDSVFPLAWLLDRTQQILGRSTSHSRAGLECWRGWKLHGHAGTPTLVGTAKQGSAGCLQTTVSVPCIWQHSYSRLILTCI